MTSFTLRVFRALRALPDDDRTQAYARLLLDGFRIASLNVARSLPPGQAEKFIEELRSILFRSLEALAAVGPSRSVVVVVDAKGGVA